MFSKAEKGHGYFCSQCKYCKLTCQTRCNVLGLEVFCIMPPG